MYAGRRVGERAGEGRDGDGRHVIVVGDGDLSAETVRALEGSGASVSWLQEPDEKDMREALEGDSVDAVAVVARADAIVLRMALMVRAVDEDVPLLLTIFDRTMAEHMERDLGHTQVTSLADIVAPSLAGPCIDERFTAVTTEDGRLVGLVEGGDGDVGEEPIPEQRQRRPEALARAIFTPFDKSAGLLLFGAIGLIAIFLVETVTAVFVLDDSVVDAVYGSAKTLVTVDPNLKVSKGPGWYKVFTSATMLVALVFAAAFTAGLVDRVTDRRLTGMLGRRKVPRRDHVVVVGLGPGGAAPLHDAAGLQHARGGGGAGCGRRDRGRGPGGGPARGAGPRCRPVADAPAVDPPGAGRGRGDLGRPREHLDRDDGARHQR